VPTREQTGDGRSRSTAPLTALEARTLESLGAGKPYKTVAHECGVSQSAVKARVLSAKEKLRARNVAHALVLAMSQQLIVGPEARD
jgi:DNA-binding CsgD family transcriptional regulator